MNESEIDFIISIYRNSYLLDRPCNSICEVFFLNLNKKSRETLGEGRRYTSIIRY